MNQPKTELPVTFSVLLGLRSLQPTTLKKNGKKNWNYSRLTLVYSLQSETHENYYFRCLVREEPLE